MASRRSRKRKLAAMMEELIMSGDTDSSFPAPSANSEPAADRASSKTERTTRTFLVVEPMMVKQPVVPETPTTESQTDLQFLKEGSFPLY